MIDSTNRELILQTAEDLLKEKGTLTTLDLKEELIQRYPDVIWRQEDVSFIMMNASISGLNGKELGYHDTGRYRVYGYKGTTSGSVRPVTRTKLASIILENSGKELTVKFTKKNGDLRTMICIPISQDSLGYIQVDEEGNGRRLVDPRTLERVDVNGLIYKLK